jgi:hypothetical protein
MTRTTRFLAALAAIAVLPALPGCGPSSDDDDVAGGADGAPEDRGGEPDASAEPSADADLSAFGGVSGTVWAPGNAPGLVPAGHEIPVAGALVYLASRQPDPIPEQVHCDECIDPPNAHAITDHTGAFTIDYVNPGIHWLVVQKGQFRRSQILEVGEGEQIALTPEQTTLPSVHDPDAGLEMPRIAVAAGAYDHLEDILGKMGMGQVDASGTFVPNTAAGVFDVYANGSYEMDTAAIAPLADLLEDYEQMKRYHIIFIGCSSQTWPDGSGLSGAPQLVWQNLRQYVTDGGKLYVTDWSGEFADNVFPEQIRFVADHDTPATAWNGTDWNPTQFSHADGFPPYESLHGRAVDEELASWLDGQQGPLVDYGSYGTGVMNAGAFAIEGNWDHIEELVSVEVGVDDKGFPVIDEPHAYIVGDEDGVPASCAADGACKPLTVTFEPAGCGRVLYSTYHTAESAHVGLVPQERVLLYLIMELGICKSGPIVE